MQKDIVSKWKKDYLDYDTQCPEVDENNYLLENNWVMKEFLETAGLDFSENNYFHNKQVPNSGIKNRPDHRFEKEKIIVEFDGLQHYQKIEEIKKDRLKDEVYGKMGYKVIRIPFFVQPCTEVIKHYFGIDRAFPLKYPQGFIIYNSTPPAHFCILGIERFVSELKGFPKNIRLDIIKSLHKLIELAEKKEYVIPKEYEYILKITE